MNFCISVLVSSRHCLSKDVLCGKNGFRVLFRCFTCYGSYIFRHSGRVFIFHVTASHGLFSFMWFLHMICFLSDLILTWLILTHDSCTIYLLSRGCFAHDSLIYLIDFIFFTWFLTYAIILHAVHYFPYLIITWFIYFNAIFFFTWFVYFSCDFLHASFTFRSDSYLILSFPYDFLCMICFHIWF